MDLREISRASFVTAAGLALPFLFHALRLGNVFLPMYLPLLAGAFLLSPRWALAVGALTPLVSAFATGMPPLFPPIALWMSVELGTMGLLAALAYRRTALPVAVILAAVLLVGRVIYAALVFSTAAFFKLPPRLLSVASFVSGWPGMLLAMFAIPAALAAIRRIGPSAEARGVDGGPI